MKVEKPMESRMDYYLILNQVYLGFQKKAYILLHIEAGYPAKSNSGIYLRGRYEVQVEDSYGKDPSSILLGGVYGFLTPNQWQKTCRRVASF